MTFLCNSLSSLIIIILLTNVISATIQFGNLCPKRDTWNVIRRSLHVPDLDELALVLGNRLNEHFEDVTAEVRPCPDLRTFPYRMANIGMNGNARLLDIGSLSYIVPLVNKSKSYSLTDLISYADLDRAFVFGAGGGAFRTLGYNSEGMFNFNVRSCKLYQRSIASRVDNTTSRGFSTTRLNNNDTDISLVGALFASSGLPGTTYTTGLSQLGLSSMVSVSLPSFVGAMATQYKIKFLDLLHQETTARYYDTFTLNRPIKNLTRSCYYCKVVKLTLGRRINQSFELTHGLHDLLDDFYGPAKTVGLGVIIVFREGIARLSIMPDFPNYPILSGFLHWVNYFNATGPLVVMGTVVTRDMGLKLYSPHFHAKSGHVDAGHWHYDLTPNESKYELLLSPGEYVYRVDMPGGY